MHYAMLTPPGEESAVDDFAAHILSMLRYDEPDRVSAQAGASYPATSQTAGRRYEAVRQ
jgi:hypothetical protein